MNWTRFALTVLAMGNVSAVTDWLFMGDLLYKNYNTHHNPVLQELPTARPESSDPLRRR